MSDVRELRKERNLQLKIRCIEYALRINGNTAGESSLEKNREDVVKTAQRIYEFLTTE